MSASMPEPGVLGWVRSNLAIFSMLLAFLSTVCGGLVTGTLRLAAYDNRMEALERGQTERMREFVGINETLRQRAMAMEAEVKERNDRRMRLAEDLLKIDKRLALIEHAREADAAILSRVATIDLHGSSGLGEMRHDLEERIGALAARDAVLESQTKFLGEFIRDNFLQPKTVGTKRCN